VFGIFDDTIQDKDLPWAIPEFSFIGSLVGSFIVPPIGTIVSIYFDNGEIYFPKYTTKVINKKKMPKNKDTDYPDNMIFFETDHGDRFEINRKKDTVLFEHSSGTKVKIDKLGNVDIESKVSIKTYHKLFLEDSVSIVIPGEKGPFCAIPICPYSGLQHIGNKCTP